MSLRRSAGAGSSCRTCCATSCCIGDRARLARSSPRPRDREENGFAWGPIQEVAKLFAGIFLTHRPGARHAASRAGRRLCAAGRARHATRTAQPNNAAYFWLTGGLSSFLDNAPTYLVFFKLAGGDAASADDRSAR